MMNLFTICDVTPRCLKVYSDFTREIDLRDIINLIIPLEHKQTLQLQFSRQKEHLSAISPIDILGYLCTKIKNKK